MLPRLRLPRTGRTTPPRSPLTTSPSIWPASSPEPSSIQRRLPRLERLQRRRRPCLLSLPPSKYMSFPNTRLHACSILPSPNFCHKPCSPLPLLCLSSSLLCVCECNIPLSLYHGPDELLSNASVWRATEKVLNFLRRPPFLLHLASPPHPSCCATDFIQSLLCLIGPGGRASSSRQTCLWRDEYVSSSNPGHEKRNARP